YEPIAAKYRIPIVVTGFEPLDLLHGIWMTVAALEEGGRGGGNQCTTSGARDGNRRAAAILEEVFEVCDRQWRGVGSIPLSGYRLAGAYERFDAAARFQ